MPGIIKGPNPGKTVLPPGTFAFQFAGMKLHGYTQDVTDDLRWRIAVHEFDHRDGQLNENMGRAGQGINVTLIWVTQTDPNDPTGTGTIDGLSDATDFIQALKDDGPNGLLIHPLYGKMQATCNGATGARLQVSEANAYTMPVSFAENNISVESLARATQGVGVQSQAVTSQAAATNDSGAALVAEYL